MKKPLVLRTDFSMQMCRHVEEIVATAGKILTVWVEMGRSGCMNKCPLMLVN